MNSDLLKDYLHVPLLIQLKLPLVGALVTQKVAFPHFKDGIEVPVWVPQPAASKEGPEATQLLQGAIISRIDDAMGTCEIQWLALNATPRSVIATLMDLDNIAAVTRVVSVTEPPEPSRIITG